MCHCSDDHIQIMWSPGRTDGCFPGTTVSAHGKTTEIPPTVPVREVFGKLT